MEFEDYDVMGNFKEFENANIDALIASTKHPDNQSMNNDSQNFDELDDSLMNNKTSKRNNSENKKALPTIKKSPPKRITTKIQKTNEKKGKTKSTRKSNGRLTRSQKKILNNNRDNDDDDDDTTFESSELRDYDFSSDDEANNLFSILDEKKSVSDIVCEGSDNSSRSECLKKNQVLNPPLNTQKGRARRNYMSKLADEIINKSIVEISDVETRFNTGIRHIAQQSRRRGRRTRQRDPNVITIGSDSEYDETESLPPIAIKCNVKNSSYSNLESENPELDIKIEWRDKIEVHKLRKFQKFSNIMQMLADREHCDVRDVLLNLNNKVVCPNDSPNNINYKSYDIISGRIVKNTLTDNLMSKHNNCDEFQLKVQSSLWKKRIIVSVNQNEPVSHIYIKISEDIKMATDKFLLYFDGELLKKGVKICDLDIEEGEILDLVIKK